MQPDTMQDQDATGQSVSLPLDIIGVIARFLINDDAIGTCASLNVTCNAVEAETTPILWKIFVLWTAKKVQALSESIWSADAVNDTSEQKQRLQREWEGIRNHRGAQWIQYLAVPSISKGMSTSEERFITEAINDKRFVRLKGIIYIQGRSGEQEVALKLIMMPAYRFGSYHLSDLVGAIVTFQRLGGPIVTQACNDAKGVVVFLCASPPTSPATSHKTSSVNQFLGPLPYIPQKIEICQIQACDKERTAGAFIESVNWLASKNLGKRGPLREVDGRVAVAWPTLD